MAEDPLDRASQTDLHTRSIPKPNIKHQATSTPLDMQAPKMNLNIPIVIQTFDCSIMKDVLFISSKAKATEEDEGITETERSIRAAREIEDKTEEVLEDMQQSFKWEEIEDKERYCMPYEIKSVSFMSTSC